MTHPAPDVQSPLPADTPAEEVISRELYQGERLIWAGRPPQNLRWTWLDPINVFVVLLYIAAGLRVLVLANNVPATLAGVVIMCIGGYHFARRFVLIQWWCRHTWYGLTSARVMIVRLRWNGRRVKQSLPHSVTDALDLYERSDGGGLILLGRRTWWEWLGTGNPVGYEHWTPRGYTGFALELPEKARLVFELIRDARRANLLTWTRGIDP